MTLQEQRDVIQAAIGGKSIELSEVTQGQWRSCTPILFNFSYYDYRVKPEPREWTARVYPDGQMVSIKYPVYPAGDIIHVREVLPSPQS